MIRIISLLIAFAISTLSAHSVEILINQDPSQICIVDTDLCKDEIINGQLIHEVPYVFIFTTKQFDGAKTIFVVHHYNEYWTKERVFFYAAYDEDNNLISSKTVNEDWKLIDRTSKTWKDVQRIKQYFTSTY